MKSRFFHAILISYICLAANTLAFADSVSDLVNGLSDPDVSARRAAIGGLFMIAVQTTPVLALPNAKPSKLKNPAVQAALIKAASDSDAAVRQCALQTYALTYKLTPDLENKIIAEFNSPESHLPHHQDDRPALLEDLMISRPPSPHATEFLTKLLDDPKWVSFVAERMAADNCPLSGPALDKLASLLAQDKDPVNRANYASAIGAYGKQAGKYAPQLKEAIAQEKDDVTKQNLQQALHSIQ